MCHTEIVHQFVDCHHDLAIPKGETFCLYGNECANFGHVHRIRHKVTDPNFDLSGYGAAKDKKAYEKERLQERNTRISWAEKNGYVVLKSSKICCPRCTGSLSNMSLPPGAQIRDAPKTVSHLYKNYTNAQKVSLDKRARTELAYHLTRDLSPAECKELLFAILYQPRSIIDVQSLVQQCAAACHGYLSNWWFHEVLGKTAERHGYGKFWTAGWEDSKASKKAAFEVRKAAREKRHEEWQVRETRRKEKADAARDSPGGQEKTPEIVGGFGSKIQVVRL